MLITERFIKNVKTILERERLSITDLAKLSGISQGGLSDFLNNERGRSPSLDYAERISLALGYPLPALLCDIEYPSVSTPISEDIACVCAIVPKVRASYVTLWHHDFADECRKVEAEFAKKQKLKLK